MSQAATAAPDTAAAPGTAEAGSAMGFDAPGEASTVDLIGSPYLIKFQGPHPPGPITRTG